MPTNNSKPNISVNFFLITSLTILGSIKLMMSVKYRITEKVLRENKKEIQGVNMKPLKNHIFLIPKKKYDPQL